MIMRYFIFLSLLIICSCGNSRKKENVNGIWVPEVVDWQDGSFDTYYIKEDTVIIISSMQKLIHDSIYFRTEPGFKIMKGVLKLVGDQKYLLPHRILYRTLKLPGINSDDIITDTISVVASNDTTIKLNINGINFIQGKLYTNESKESIITMATKMVPDLEKHPEEFEE
jgi:hypothetical protein